MSNIACADCLGFGRAVVLLFCCAVVANASANASFTTSRSVGTCPGAEPATITGLLNCTAACQQAVCTALATFFVSTYNPTDAALRSWRDRQGWDNLQSQTCAQLLTASTASGSPAYCDWYGVTCCSGGPAPPLAAFLPPGDICTVLNSVVELHLPVNGLSGSVTNAALQQSIGQLHACGMTRITLSGNALSGSLSDFWGDLVNLTTLNLARNSITGTIPDAIRKLTKLAELQLDRNTMMGTIPEWLTEMPSLQWLALNMFRGRNKDGRQGLIGTIPGSIGNLQGLTILALGSNSLTGTLPAIVCSLPLAILDLHGNEIQGHVSQLLGCTRLYMLDIHSNQFKGVLPEVPTWPWYGLSVLDLSHNAIEGTIPMAFYRTPVIDNINLASNRLTGTISSAIGRMQMIVSINLANNQLTGHIPAELGTVTNLRAVILSNNNMSCSGELNNDGRYRCNSEQMLPCFLQLTPVTVPRPDASNMECPVVVWKSHDIAVQDCSGSGATQLGYQASDLAEMDITGQLWQLDPSYYQYAGCKCLAGYQAVWSDNSTVLNCQPSQATLAPWFIPTAVVSSFIGICILGAAGLLVWLRVTIQLRWKWQRDRDLLKYRQKGVPSGGPATIVVTDVESYSELMQQNAAVTTRAMATHNAILRKAVTAHAGHVIEQEGDSWSVAFHRAVDAVAFCLQVQQALQKSQWPSKLSGPPAVKSERYASNKTDPSDPGPASGEVYMEQISDLSADSGGSAAGLASSKGESQQGVVIDRTRSAPVVTATTGGSNSRSEPGEGLLAGVLRRVGGKRRSSGIKAAGPAAQHSGSVSHSSADVSIGIAGRATASSLGEVVASRMGSLTQARQRRTSVESSVSADRESSVVETASKAGRTSSVTWSIRGKGTSRRLDSGTVRGLKVRMGVVSGMLAPNSDIRRSPLFELAKAVSDMANGGQVLTDHSTAMAIREWLTILGGIDHKGYNDQLVLQATRAEIRKQARTHFLGLLSALFRSPLSIVSPDRHPVLLDMGQLWVPGLVSCLEAVTTTMTLDTKNKHHASPLAALPLAALLGRKSNLPFGTGHKQLLHLHGGNAAIAAAAVACVHGGEAAANSSPGLHLFCVGARPLHARCKLWKGKLNLTATTQHITKGYFDAPGAAASDLGPSGGLLDADRPQLPPVTMVFAVVEGGKVLVRKKERVAAEVHTVLVRTMHALLLSLPDGYLCREQEAVLKYMVAFREPARAAEWCLMLQEVLHQIPWSREVTQGFASLAASPTASNSGLRATSSTAGLGGRPRLKIGVAEGVPDDMYPDHLGRADYFGTSINLAARIMSAAASPGQIAMSIETAQGMFSTWRYEAEMGLYKGTAAVQQLQPGSCQDGECQFSLSGVGNTPKPGPRAADHTSDLAPDSLAAAGSIRDSLDLSLPNSHSSQPGQLLASEQQQQQPNSHVALQDNRSDVPTHGSKLGLTGLHLEPIACTVLSSEGAVISGTRSPAALGPDVDKALMGVSLPGGGSDKRILLISAHNIGTYAFKGCGAMDMVCLTSDALPLESYARSAAPPKGAKGTLIMASDGPVLGLQDCPVLVPNILPEFRKAWANVGANASQPGSPELSLPSTRFFDDNSSTGSARHGGVLSGKEQHPA